MALDVKNVHKVDNRTKMIISGFMVMQNYINSANDISDPSNDAKGVLIDAMGVER